VYNQIVNLQPWFYEAKLDLPETDKSFQTTLVTIDKSPISWNYLWNILFQQKSSFFIKPIQKIGRRFVQNFLDEQLAQYYNDNLEKNSWI
jgi:peptidyl-prolyl cis-trans isomerase SurA